MIPPDPRSQNCLYGKSVRRVLCSFQLMRFGNSDMTIYSDCERACDFAHDYLLSKNDPTKVIEDLTTTTQQLQFCVSFDAKLVIAVRFTFEFTFIFCK